MIFFTESRTAQALLDRVAIVQVSSDIDKLGWLDGSKDITVKAIYLRLEDS